MKQKKNKKKLNHPKSKTIFMNNNLQTKETELFTMQEIKKNSLSDCKENQVKVYGYYLSYTIEANEISPELI